MAVQKARTKLKAKAKAVAAKAKPVAKAKLQAKAKAVATRAKAKVKAAVQKKPKAIPDGYPPLSPIAVMQRAGEAIEFYKNVFGAKERMRMPLPDGKLAHAELGFGPSVLMLADEMGPFKGAPQRLVLYAEDCDAVYQKALAAGAQSNQEPQDQFYGDRSCRVTDPFGNEWTIMTHKEDVSPEEMQRRMAAMGPPPGEGGAPPSSGEQTPTA